MFHENLIQLCVVYEKHNSDFTIAIKRSLFYFLYVIKFTSSSSFSVFFSVRVAFLRIMSYCLAKTSFSF